MRKRPLNFFKELEKQQLSTTIRMNCWSANRTAGLKTISSFMQLDKAVTLMNVEVSKMFYELLSFYHVLANRCTVSE